MALRRVGLVAAAWFSAGGVAADDAARADEPDGGEFSGQLRSERPVGALVAFESTRRDTPRFCSCFPDKGSVILEIFNELARHHLINTDNEVVQTFEPQLTPLQQQVLDLLHIPASIYNQIGTP
ncbi:MAG: hypothetical protein ACYDAQ_16855 [Mycobacteriales bacterium]